MSTLDSPLQREIRQALPFRSKAHEATVGLLRTADVVRQGLAKAIAPSGLTFQQYNVLRILRGAGEAGLPTLEISDRMIERAPGITRLLDRLEQKGLVRRERCSADRRQVLCWPTAEALAVLAELDSPVDHADSHAMRALPEEEQAQLVKHLDTIRLAHSTTSEVQPGAKPTLERDLP